MLVSRLLTHEEASKYLSVQPETLNSLPSLPVVMVGREPRYMARDLDRWILARRIVPIATMAA